MAMENEDYGQAQQESALGEDRMVQDHDAAESLGEQIGDTMPVRNAFSRRTTRTSKQPWYEPYLREIRRTH